MFSKIKSTTALVTCLSLGLQAPAMAQGNGEGRALGLAKQTARDLGLQMCMDADAPCVTEENLVLLPADATGEELSICATDAVEAPCVREEDGQILAEAESELVVNVLAGVSTEGGAVQVEDNAVMEAASSPAGDDDAADTTASAEAEAAIEAEPAPADQPAISEAGTEADAEAEGEAETADAAGDTEGAAEEEEVAAETLEAPADDADAGEMIEEQTTAEVIEAPEGDVEDVDVSEQIEEETTAEVIEAPETETAEAEDVIEEEPVQATAAAAAATDEGASAEAEVVTEDVTEESSRSATEDFETAATVTEESAAPADDDSLSNFEKALLLGLGAVAVGSILDNGDEVVSNSGDRLVVRESDGELRILKNDDALLRQPGAQVQTETFNDGSTRTTVTREDGSRIVTIRSAEGVVLRRVRVLEDGTQIILVDDTAEVQPVRVSELPEPRPAPETADASDEDALRAALAEAEWLSNLDRSFSLRQVREIREVRELAPQVELDAITFATGSAAIQPSQAEELAALGRVMSRIIEERPEEVFLIEGHSDAVGDATYNLALSDRRAETVALALTEYFDVPPENMVVQGYGERFLKIETLEAERLNRRAAVRRITPLISVQTARR
ncbi:OmpA family protein [Alphaproteobacteria bacterium GH1-50]|uniref:OmpA family protein n=1 Tax=Kangsaoukella pontilimi TaxID=2691042 RepID=A0A7C9MVJ1_9RHOB|nr:OmpA family protein [Kangsaoukella pontilimi]MXQ07700.1 OmpA family protein [Kangsaoukella pontilimi]